ncbi:HAD family hydrolase [Microbacterium aquimaris]|uniref:HAD family hydrolase n=1 Tax=Microbacterium aquimaris TaxID=459816 RepID=UPI003373BFC5
MSSGELPGIGEVEVETEAGTAETVEALAQGDSWGGRTPERVLIALDIDGTVILEDESMSPGVVEAVADAVAAGHEVMLSTGRSWASTEPILTRLDIAPEYVVCANGAAILRRADAQTREYELHHTEQFDAHEVLTLLREHLPDAHYMVERPDGHRLYTDYVDDWNLGAADRVPFDQLAADPVSRVVVISPENTNGEFLELVQRIGLNEVSYAVGWTAWLDIAPQGVDKGTALERVRADLGLDPAHVLVIGDGRNDIGMFEWAVRNGGRAIAMGQSPDEVRAAANASTHTVHEGGVAAALRAL